MTITLPLATRMRPLVRLLYRTYNGEVWSDWQALMMAQRFSSGTAHNGFLVDGWSRHALPFIGEATLRYRHGYINGRRFPQTDDQGKPIPADLRHAEIRIQISPPPAFAFAFNQNAADFGTTFSPTWRTCWWGTVEQQVEVPADGEVVFHCCDGLFRAKRWQMVHHFARVGATSYSHVRGHPGYNLSLDGYFARTLGNKEPSGLTTDPTTEIAAATGVTNKYFAHTWPNGIAGAAGASAKWTDKEVIDHALQSSRGRGDPVFACLGETHLLGGSSGWPVFEGMRAWDLVAMVADRRRGRGLLFVDWADDSGAPMGPLSTFLTVRSQFQTTISYTPPGGVELTITGAATAGRTRALDLVNDQRLLAGSLKFGDRMQYLMDYVENNGEPIEVLITPDYASESLTKRWIDADATAFVAIIEARRRATARWDPVYQRHGLNPEWNCKVGDGKGGAPTRCDYQCKDDGTLWDLTVAGAPAESSPIVVKMSNDLPLYEGYDYTTSSPVRYDAATEQIAPPRRPVMALGKFVVGSDDYIDLMRIGFQLQMDRQYGIYLKYGYDQSDQFAGRFFSAPGVHGFAYTYQSVLVTVGVSFGNRVRMATGRSFTDANGTARLGTANSQNRLYIHHPGLSLWVAHPGAIWEMDRTTASTASAPGKRAAAGGAANVPGILRDDRAALAQLHALTKVWYLTEHRTASWAMDDCGFLQTFADDLQGDVQYHKLGDLLTTVTYTDHAGDVQVVTADTPVTGVVFDNILCQTRWDTDWSDLDFVNR